MVITYLYIHNFKDNSVLYSYETYCPWSTLLLPMRASRTTALETGNLNFCLKYGSGIGHYAYDKVLSFVLSL